ncbi:Mannan endo-1,4-beta-mannosidase-like protein [Quillaja saponaria]|uniref:mannan endo-1,4-beta-mannosidase n=1 Tax=Quillaja saponaria TaxID=32244 RepID=A0AAD7M0D2_QUISA|nr:Mannan endo-1,4-beta-mannosidase-like protein [Quillaja saponaria]
MMKHFCVVFLVLLVIQKQGSLVQVEAEDGFVKTSGVQFILNGSPYYANGFNAYWLMYMASQSSQRDKVSSAFQQAADHGLNIARTWAFSDGGDIPLQYSPGSYNEQMFQGLDFVLSEARKHGIKLVLSLVNNYESLGGKKQYVDWARSQGQAITAEDDFYTNPVVKGYYKNHIKTVLTRHNTLTGVAYKDDSTIMAWELMNEPRCTSDQSGRTIQAWITEMASYLKSIDGNHLLEAGLEGFYGQTKQHSNPNSNLVGTDFIANNQIPGIDFATVHSYPDQWLSGPSFESLVSFLSGWMNDHIQDAQNTLKKPVIFAEFGLTMKEFGFNPSQRDQLYDTVYSKIYSSASAGGAAAGGLFWQLLSEGMDSFRDGYEVILTESSSTVSLISEEAHKLGRIRKMYARLRNIEKWKKAREIRGAQSSAGINGRN